MNVILRPVLHSSLLESFTLLSGSAMPPPRLKSPCVTRIQRTKTLQTVRNMPRRWKLPEKLCSVLRSARSSCATSLRPCQLISPHWSKNVRYISSVLSFICTSAVVWLCKSVTCFSTEWTLTLWTMKMPVWLCVIWPLWGRSPRALIFI